MEVRRIQDIKSNPPSGRPVVEEPNWDIVAVALMGGQLSNVEGAITGYMKRYIRDEVLYDMDEEPADVIFTHTTVLGSTELGQGVYNLLEHVVKQISEGLVAAIRASGKSIMASPVSVKVREVLYEEKITGWSMTIKVRMK